MSSAAGRSGPTPTGEAWTGGERSVAGPGALRVNMHWTLVAPDPKVARGSQFDVDLAALYELTDHTRGAVQFLGGLRGAFERAPFISHDRDDRAGSAAGENLFVNLDRGDKIRRVLIYVYTHNGPLANARVTVEFYAPGQSRPFHATLERVPSDAHACAVALLAPTGGQWTARRELHYVPGYQSDIDHVYGFGLRWARQDKPGLT